MYISGPKSLNSGVTAENMKKKKLLGIEISMRILDLWKSTAPTVHSVHSRMLLIHHRR